MPTYSYVCEKGHAYEEVRKMSENPSRTTCAKPDCGTRLIRKFGAPSITFKGTGFNANRG